jgi:hypothetical protein
LFIVNSDKGRHLASRFLPSAHVPHSLPAPRAFAISIRTPPPIRDNRPSKQPAGRSGKSLYIFIQKNSRLRIQIEKAAEANGTAEREQGAGRRASKKTPPPLGKASSFSAAYVPSALLLLGFKLDVPLRRKR